MFIIFKLEKNTFHQNDDNIRDNILLPILNQNKKYKNVLFIGGECYIFGSLVNAENIYSYSDCESIVNDCKRNKNIYGGNICNSFFMKNFLNLFSFIMFTNSI